MELGFQKIELTLFEFKIILLKSNIRSYTFIPSSFNLEP